MIRLVFAIWLAFTTMAAAAPVLVKSGEHDGFTRLVLEYDGPVDWQVGRTEDGYALRIANKSPSYDLTETFKVIGKSRLAGISTDPNSGALNLAIACACYAIPFEFRPGIMVIDLRDGRPPKGSSFEEPLAQTAQLEANTEPVRPDITTARYDWTLQALAQLQTGQPKATNARPFTALPNSDPALQPLRDSLLHQLSRGAAQGVVDMAELHSDQTVHPAAAGEAIGPVRVGLGELPSVSMSNGLPDHDKIGAQGQACVEADRLDVASWGDDSPVFAQIAKSSEGLIAEFDKADPAVLQRAVQFHLFVGFGAEAQQLMQAFPMDLPDKPLWQSMARLVDGRPDLGSAFIGQEACDSPAALWAILAQPKLDASQRANTNAAFLAFSALPIGLRRDLGPVLADRFMAIGANDAATRVRDAILRAPGGPGPDAALLTARIEMRQGDAAAAEVTLQQMVADPGPGTATALVALVEARIAQDLPIAPDMVVALEAVAQEQTGSATAPAAIRALLLAKAASGDIEAAFALLPDAPEAEPKLWRILSLLGTDDAVLAHAVLVSSAPEPKLTPETAAKLAGRLLHLGMADSALQWLRDESRVDPLLLATIQLQRHDGRAALRALTGQYTPDALKLRALAMQQLGDEAAAAQIYAQSGDSAAEQRALSIAENWADTGVRGADPWKHLANELSPAPSPDAGAAVDKGPLAVGKQLVERSATTRDAIDALLTQVAAP
ncbi:hypothetical protein [Cypionkella sp.]|jgi:tetratricopeptide (TPR) repeat protein|uniref:hypothetical protein n=1 Tax=Cypionkella sp. TaxID=2811411 RepID=UPI00271E54FA|nr:hypothetical protein [Cypionkella sp.]MDO8983417.1 hypothetical protein [Cypionkella sp.]MDP2050261.1 hypothetical protein [Cypionkella sp.]